MATTEQIRQWALANPGASPQDVRQAMQQYGVSIPQIDAALMPLYYGATPQQRMQYRTLWNSILDLLGRPMQGSTPRQATQTMMDVAGAGGFDYHPATVDSPYHQAAVLANTRQPMTPERHQARQELLRKAELESATERLNRPGWNDPYLAQEIINKGLLGGTGTISATGSGTGGTQTGGLLGGQQTGGAGQQTVGAGQQGNAFVPVGNQFIPPGTGTWNPPGVPGWLLQYGTPLQGGLPWITTPLYGAPGLRFGGFR